MVGIPPRCGPYPQAKFGKPSLGTSISQVSISDFPRSLYIIDAASRLMRRDVRRACTGRQRLQGNVDGLLYLPQAQNEAVHRVHLAGIAEAPDEVRLRLGGGADARRRQRAILFLVTNRVLPAADQYTSDYKQRSKKIRGEPRSAGGTINH